MPSRKISIVEPIVSVIVIILLWELLVRVFNVPTYFIPPPSKVFEAFFTYERLGLNILATLEEVLFGFFAAVVVGLIVAIAISQSAHLERGFYPMLALFQSVPKSALAPIFIVWFGFGLMPKIMVAFLIVFFPLLVNTLSGLTITQAELLELMRQLRASKLQILMKIRLPNSLPFIFTGLKIAAPQAVLGAIVAEFMVGDVGLGYMVLEANYRGNMVILFVSLVIMAALGITLFWLVKAAEKLVPRVYMEK